MFLVCLTEDQFQIAELSIRIISPASHLATLISISPRFSAANRACSFSDLRTVVAHIEAYLLYLGKKSIKMSDIVLGSSEPYVKTVLHAKAIW